MQLRSPELGTNSFGQDSGKSHSDHNSKCGRLQDAGGCAELTNEEQGTEN
jgi:hypothetical protein